jgi:hypothetical protein
METDMEPDMDKDTNMEMDMELKDSNVIYRIKKSYLISETMSEFALLSPKFEVPISD